MTDRIQIVINNAVVFDNSHEVFAATTTDAAAVQGPTMAEPLERYTFGAGVTALPMPVKAGTVYTVEAIPPGYGAGSVKVMRGDGGVVERDITNGYCSAFPVQATADESWTVIVKSTTPGSIRYAAPS